MPVDHEGLGQGARRAEAIDARLQGQSRRVADPGRHPLHVRPSLQAIDAQPDDLQSLAQMGARRGVQDGHFSAAGCAPRRPETQDDHLAPRLGQVERSSVQQGGRDLRRWLAGARHGDRGGRRQQDERDESRLESGHLHPLRSCGSGSAS